MRCRQWCGMLTDNGPDGGITEAKISPPKETASLPLRSPGPAAGADKLGWCYQLARGV